jgi:hypothetical protein
MVTPGTIANDTIVDPLKGTPLSDFTIQLFPNCAVNSATVASGEIICKTEPLKESETEFFLYETKQKLTFLIGSKLSNSAARAAGRFNALRRSGLSYFFFFCF